MDPVTIQTLVTLGSFLVLGTVYIVNGRIGAKVLGARLEGIDKTMGEFKEELKKMQDVLVAQALQGARIQTLDERTLATGLRLDKVGNSVGKILMHLAIKEDSAS